MTPAAAKASLSRFIASGDLITLQRGMGPDPLRSTKQVRVKFLTSDPRDLTASVSENERRLVMSADDVAASGFPLPLKKTDRLDLGGRLLAIGNIDDTTRRVAGVLIGYELRVTGL